MTTTSGGLPLMAQTQNSRYLTYNELAWAVNVLQTGVLDRDLTTPPGSPSEGDAYIVDSPATGAWAGHENDIAFYFGGVWNFLEPELAQGNGIYVADEGYRVRWSTGSPTGYEVLTVGSDASTVTYTPAVHADWDGSADPGDASDAFDQLAERVKDLEGAGANAFGIIAVSGQSNVVADTASDTLTLVAGSNITLTTSAAGDSVTIASSGGGGGGSTSTSAYASRPSAGTAGNLFFPSDGFHVERDTGSAWVPWGPLFPMTQPVDGDYSWVNQGGASVSTTKGGIFLQSTLQASDQLRCRVKTAPATPYTVTACILPSMVGFNYVSCGILFRQSSDGKLATLSITHNNDWVLDMNKWSSATAISANYTSYSIKGVPCPLWLRIADNGTNRICSWSSDGQNFTALHTVGRTDFMTADQVGFFCNGNSNSGTSVAPCMTLLSWKEA